MFLKPTKEKTTFSSKKVFKYYTIDSIIHATMECEQVYVSKEKTLIKQNENPIQNPIQTLVKNDSYNLSESICKNKNNCEILELIRIKERIECMSKKHQIDVLKILNNDQYVILNENNNGVFINLNELDINILNKLLEFISYVTNQETHLNSVETIKHDIEKTYFS